MLRWLHDELARPSLSASSAWEWPPSKAMPRCRRGPPRAGSSVRRSGRSRPGGGLRVRPSSSRGCAGDPHSARPTGAASAQRGDRARLRAADLSVASAAVIDLHCHLLPALDDGPAEEQASIALARRLVEDGVRIAAATPHLRSDHPDVAPAELAGRCRALEDRCADEGVPLRIVPGGEVDLLWAQSASAEDLALASYGQRGSDLLVETPYGPLPRSFERLVSELQEAGFRILLAHPERSPTFQQDPQRLAELVARAVLVQVTASSLVGNPRRSRSTGLARALVENGSPTSSHRTPTTPAIPAELLWRTAWRPLASSLPRAAYGWSPRRLRRFSAVTSFPLLQPIGPASAGGCAIAPGRRAACAAPGRPDPPTDRAGQARRG